MHGADYQLWEDRDKGECLCKRRESTEGCRKIRCASLRCWTVPYQWCTVQVVEPAPGNAHGSGIKFIRMEKGDFLVALDKSPKSQFLQCGETLMSIEKMELPEDQKQPKPAVQKYRDAKISYAEATKKTLQGNKQPQKQENKLPPSQGKTQELKKVEDGLKTMKERTDETLAKLQTEVADLQTRLDETMSKMTQIIEGLTNATKKNEEMIVKNYQQMLNAISQIATAVNKIEAKVGLSGTTHQVTANQNHCQND